MIEKLNWLPRVLFNAAVVLAAVGLWGKVIELFGWRYTLIPYSAGRMLEFSAILVIFAIAVLLFQIRDQIKS